MAEILAIGLMVDTRTAYGRGITQGVSEYVNRVKDGRLVIQLPMEFRDLRQLRKWPFAGLIILAHHPDHLRMTRGLGIPVINVSVAQSPEKVDLPTVCSDNIAMGRMAGEYFLHLGFEHFAYFSEANRYFSKVRFQGFAAAVGAEGFDVHFFEHAAHGELDRLGPADAIERRKPLFEWLLGLPKPVAVLAANDLWGADVYSACAQVGIAVPDLVSIMGIDNEPWVHRLVPLSSVPQPGVKVGYEAAALLDQIRAGRRPPRKPVLVSPDEPIVTRQSTDAIPVRDADIARALRFIRHHADRPIGIDELLAEVPLGRRTLERRFRSIMGCSPQEQIQRVHLERAKELLSKTDLSVADVASGSGFKNKNRFGISFKTYTGLTPAQYRRQFRPARAASR